MERDYKSYANNFLENIFALEKVDDLSVRANAYKSLEINLRTLLEINIINEKSNFILTQVLCFNKSYAYVGNTLNLSRERIRQKLDKSMKKLIINPTARKILIYGVDYENKGKVIADLELKIKELESIEDTLNQKIGVLKTTINIESTPVYVEDLDLSLRSLNCLKRANINKIEDLINKTEDDLKSIKNLGYKCFTEIINNLAVCNLHLKSK